MTDQGEFEMNLKIWRTLPAERQLVAAEKYFEAMSRILGVKEKVWKRGLALRLRESIKAARKNNPVRQCSGKAYA